MTRLKTITMLEYPDAMCSTRTRPLAAFNGEKETKRHWLPLSAPANQRRILQECAKALGPIRRDTLI